MVSSFVVLLWLSVHMFVCVHPTSTFCTPSFPSPFLLRIHLHIFSLLVSITQPNERRCKKKWNDHLLSEWNGRMREDETRIRSCPSDIMTLDRQITSTTGSTHESGDGSYGSRNRKVWWFQKRAMFWFGNVNYINWGRRWWTVRTINICIFGKDISRWTTIESEGIMMGQNGRFRENGKWKWHERDRGRGTVLQVKGDRGTWITESEPKQTLSLWECEREMRERGTKSSSALPKAYNNNYQSIFTKFDFYLRTWKIRSDCIIAKADNDT